MNSKTNCDSFREMIFCLEESSSEPFSDGGLSETERNELGRHLKHCQICRALRVQEKRLTTWLTGNEPISVLDRPQAITRGRKASHRNRLPNFNAWNVVAVIAGLAIIGVTVWQLGMFSSGGDGRRDQAANDVRSDQSLGSMVYKPIMTSVSLKTESTSTRVDSNNHVDLPAGTAAIIELNDTGRIDAIGPALFEIDRISEGWKVTLLTGQLKITLDKQSSVQIVGQQGVQWIRGGVYRIRSVGHAMVHALPLSDINIHQDDETDDQDVESMRERGLRVFHADSKADKKQYAEAAILLSKVFEHKDAKPNEKNSAGFYAMAAFMNSGQYTAALKLGSKWQKYYKGQMGESVPVMMAQANFALGNRKEAVEIAKQVLKEYPDTPYKTSLLAIVGEEDAAVNSRVTNSRALPPEKAFPYTSTAESSAFIAGQSNGYLVINVGLDQKNEDHNRFLAVSKQIVRFHKAKTIQFDGLDFEKLRSQLAELKPANVLFVIPPRLLDVNFHRNVFKIAPTLDNDLFVDFAWGYMTARDGTALGKFWKRIQGLHENGLANKNWLETGVIGGESKSKVIEGYILPAALSAGFQGKQLYFACIESDPNVLEFIDKQKAEFEQASIIAMTGNGDPQGIWLFDGGRNANPQLHWQFDKTKVGQDPQNEMPRLKSDWFAGLELQSPIIWSGTCHSGACYRVYVEGDIVSTFGTSEKTETYDLPPDESLGLSLIDGGAGSLLVPIAANHGLAVSMETDFLVKYGATLGETIKSTYDDAIMQAGGIPKLLVAKLGDPPNYFGEPVMQSGAVNRILIGDPALRLVKPTTVKGEDQKSTFDVEQKRLTVEMTWDKGYHPSGWNLFADGRGFGQRMKTRIDCSEMPELIEAAGSRKLSIKATIVDDKGKQIDCDALAEVDTMSGKSFLYLQTTAENAQLPHEYHVAKFVIEWK